MPLLGRGPYPYASQEARRVSRDAYVCFRGNRYSVPWRAAGQEVLLREADGQLHVGRGDERLAQHPLCAPGAHQTVTVAAHHADLPLGAGERGGKARIHIHAGGSLMGESSAPVVEVRPLQAYEIASEFDEIASEWEASHG